MLLFVQINQPRSQVQNSLLAISAVDRFGPGTDYHFEGVFATIMDFLFMQSHAALLAVITMGIPTFPIESQLNTFRQTTCHLT